MACVRMGPFLSSSMNGVMRTGAVPDAFRVKDVFDVDEDGTMHCAVGVGWKMPYRKKFFPPGHGGDGWLRPCNFINDKCELRRSYWSDHSFRARRKLNVDHRPMIGQLKS